MPVFACMVCKKEFTRKAHVDNHSGSKRCTLNLITRSGSRLQAKRLGRRPRGLSLQGNLRRRLMTRSRAFVKYLKSNVRRCNNYCSSGPNGLQVVDFVPYSQAYSPADISHLGAMIVAGHSHWVRPVHRRSLLAATLAAGHMFTVEGVSAVGWPPAAWNPVFMDQLRSRLSAAALSSTQIFCHRFTSSATQSYLHLDGQGRAKAIGKIISTIRLCIEAADRAISRADDRRERGIQFLADDFYKDIQHKGMPLRGYTMHLSQCIWSFGGIGPAINDTSIFPPDNATAVFHSNQSGTCKGLSRLTGDPVSLLVPCAELQKIRLILLSDVVAKIWPSVAPRALDPFKKRPLAERAGCLANQLCEWAKAGYAPIA
jgi:hypothetical protein